VQRTETEAASAATDWLREFERLHGRPLRVLHIGNIANNGYINAKIQRRAGIDADVCCHDYFHVMGCPEWEDADFEGDVGDQFFPDWWAVDLHGFRRPHWFAQGRLRTCQRYLLARRRNDAKLQRLLWRQLRLEVWLRCRSTRRAAALAAFLGISRPAYAERPSLPPRASESTGEALTEWLALVAVWVSRTIAWLWWRAVRWVARSILFTGGRTRFVGRIAGRKAVAATRATGALAARRGWRTAALMIFPGRLASLARTDDQVALVRAAQPGDAAAVGTRLAALYREFFDRDGDSLPEDCRPYLSSIPAWQQLFQHYDLIQGYSLDALLPLLTGEPHYTAYEHGTLRDLPFEDSSRGRLCALAYRAAPVVFVTNSDVLPAARRLGLAEEQLVLLPHAVDSDRLLRFSAENATLRPEPGAEVVFLSPARHDWYDGDPVGAKGNDRLIRALALLRDEGLSCRLVLFEWGRHVEESRRLIEELGLGDRVTWSATLRKRDLWVSYMRAHAVVDQFVAPAMGSVAFESLALGCRVITVLDEPTVTEFFGEMPPILNGQAPPEIAAAMRCVIQDPDDSAGIGSAAQDWFRRRHSTERIVELQVAAYARVLAPAEPAVLSYE
jgi:glycosyltransferase involved in cell wall biosynthesis